MYIIEVMSKIFQESGFAALLEDPRYLVMILIACLLAGYNGELGIRSKTFQLVYKWFYPAHLLLLGIIWQLM